MTQNRAFSFDVPYCPTCGRMIGLFESFRARLDRLTCPQCGTRLKIANRPHTMAAVALYFALSRVAKLFSPLVGVSIVALIVTVGSTLEYLSARVTISSRKDGPENQ